MRGDAAFLGAAGTILTTPGTNVAAFAAVASDFSTVNANSYQFAAFTPPVNQYLVAFVEATTSSDTAPTLVSTVGGHTWSRVNSALFSSNIDCLHVFVADQVSSNVSQQLTFAATGAPQGACISVMGSPNFAHYGLTAVVQSNTIFNAVAAVTPYTNFASPCNVNNATVIGLGNASNPSGISVPTGWTLVHNLGHGTPARGLGTCRRNSGYVGSTQNFSGPSASVWGTIGVELNPNA